MRVAVSVSCQIVLCLHVWRLFVCAVIIRKRCADSTSVVTVAEDGRITPVDGDVDSRGLMSKMFCKLFGASGGPVRLSDCIQAFCAPEQLSGGNKYDCSQCKTTRNAGMSRAIECRVIC